MNLTSASLLQAAQRGVYFQSDTDTFPYVAFCLADGLEQLGISVFANIACRHPSTDFAFKTCRDPQLLQQCYCAVMSLDDICEHYPYVVNRVEAIHERTIALCMHDNLSNFIVAPEMPLLCTHESKFRKIFGSRIPIAFGLSSRILQQTTSLPEFGQRGSYILRSFHPTLHQDVRACLDLALLPILQSRIPVETYYTSSQGEFMRLLARIRFSLAYGGCFAQNISLAPAFNSMEMCRNFFSHVAFHQDTVVIRWDSWRFWESLAAGCVAIQLDFERYGFQLPIVPVNWKHYIGLNLANLRQDVERIMDEQNRMEEIAHNGRLWAIEHYSPITVARRFLASMNALYP